MLEKLFLLPALKSINTKLPSLRPKTILINVFYLELFADMAVITRFENLSAPKVLEVSAGRMVSLESFHGIPSFLMILK